MQLPIINLSLLQSDLRCEVITLVCQKLVNKVRL